MAKLQLSISHTFVLDTDEWPQSELDTLYSEIGTETPTSEQLEDAIRHLLTNNDSEFWDEHIDLGEIDSQNVKVVCIDASFNRFAQPDDEAEKEEIPPDVKASFKGKSEVASKSKAMADKASHPSKASTHPAPKTSGPGPAIQGARDSTQVKK